MLQELSQEIEKTARAVTDEIHTALPGEVVSFDVNTGLAVVEPVGKYVTSDGKLLDYPQITEVPVMFPYCEQAGAGIVFPVKKGDSCMIIISEVELDSWRSRAESEGSLRFDLTSAVAIPGLLRSSAYMVAKAIRKDAVMIVSGQTELSVSADGADITVGSTVLSVSESGIIAGGNLTVEGNIIYTGTLKAG